MNRAIWNRSRGLVVTIACAALLGTLTATAPNAQGIVAQATVKTEPVREINALLQQLLALEKRVAELEKDELEKFKGDDVAADELEKKLEQRLASLEKAQETAKSDDTAGKTPDRADDDEPMTVRAPFVVLDKAGRTIFRVYTTDDGRPIAEVGDALGATAVIGIDPRGNTSLRLFNERRAVVARLAASSESGSLVLNSEVTAKEALTLSVDQNGAGRVKVFNAAGRAVAGLTSDASGGRVLVADGKSGNNTATLSTSPEGGMVHVFAPAGGSPRAAMVAHDNSGSINVFSNSGNAVAAIESGESGGAGRLVIADASGNVMVEAGTLSKSGIGIIRAGPGGFGPAGVVGGGGVMPASSIQGRK